MRKYLLLIFVLIIIVVGLVLLLPKEKETQTTEISNVQDIYMKDTIVLSDSISRAEGFQILKYFYSSNKEYYFEYVWIFAMSSSSLHSKRGKSYGSLY